MLKEFSSKIDIFNVYILRWKVAAVCLIIATSCCQLFKLTTPPVTIAAVLINMAEHCHI